tara:strand:+ start:546 stop:764 length:219 start_codon:yes stop_codon:yes gene_type:complete
MKPGDLVHFNEGVYDEDGQYFLTGTQIGLLLEKMDGPFDDRPTPDPYWAVLASGQKYYCFSDCMEILNSAAC